AVGVVQFASPSMLQILGISADEALHSDYLSLAHPEDAAGLRAAFTIPPQSPGAAATDTRARYRHKDGSWRILDGTCTNLLHDPVIHGFVINLRDITDRQESEHEHHRLWRAVEQSPVSVVITDIEGKIEYVNPKFTRLTGYTAEEALGQNPNILKSGETPQEEYDRLWKTITSGSEWQGEFHNKKKNGELYWEQASISPIFNPAGAITHFLAVKEDITARKQAEEVREATLEQFKALINNLQMGVLVETADSKIFHTNQAFCDLFGIPAPELILGVDCAAAAQGAAPLFQDPPRFIERINRLLAESKVLLNEELRLDDGRIFERDFVPVWLRGSLIGNMWLYRDATQRKQRERELQTIASVSAALRAAGTREEMLPILLDQARELLQAGGAALATCDPVSGETNIELGQGEWQSWTGLHLAAGEGISGLVIASKQAYVNDNSKDDPRQAYANLIGAQRAAACVPLIAHEQTIGAMWVGRERGFTPEEVRLLSSIADIAANAIQRASLHELTERRLQDLQALRVIDMALAASFDLRVGLGVLLEETLARLDVAAADVLLFNPQSNTLEYTAGRGFHTGGIERSHLRLGECLAGRAVMKGEIVSVHRDLLGDTEFARRPLIAGEGFQGYHALPLIAKGQVKGVLEVYLRAQRVFNWEWRDLFATLAGQAAIAIDNAEAFESAQRSRLELSLAYDATLEGWSRAIGLREHETETHSQRVVDLTLKLAQRMGVSDDQRAHIRRGALLHDIGKLAVPDSILLKPGKLSAAEWDVMRRHPQDAYELLAPIEYLRPALDIPYRHHEKYDGSGYPDGLMGDQIPLAARIFAIVDVWDALTSDRPYRKAWTEEEARNYIREQSGKHFDPRIAEMFLLMLEMIF
ncbi:MAG: PAS domain S-box protein, partial [Chloroflexi bacterium]|nr:PAS domain S-box protein [Chloroflexota bacterium]